MQYSSDILEEELKQKVARDFFPQFDCTGILGRVDFSVSIKETSPSLFDTDFLMWGEAKRGRIQDFRTSFVQLILTIGKERTFDRYLPPKFLCEFDCRQIAFLPYDRVLEVFYVNDFNWNVAPSDHSTREFGELHRRVSGILDSEALVYRFDQDEATLRQFIKDNFKVSSDISRLRITKNNFISIYSRWLDDVKPAVAVDWEVLKRNGIMDADFYLADIMTKGNAPIMQKLNVLLTNDHYTLHRVDMTMGLFTTSQIPFNDGGNAHRRFWLKYERPPKKEYQEYILARRDLLVPQDIRERRGSYFTPRIWVEKAQQYLADVLGDNWQEEYYIWDCCGGTGNLEIGLTNKYNVYVSTLDKSDVDVMHERIEKGANLLHDHVFQFDFLNDGFKMTAGGLVDDLCNCDKLPASLREILRNRPSRLVWFVNPPYAEASDVRTVKGGTSKKAVEQSNANLAFSSVLHQANAELFAQFFVRMYGCAPGSVIAEFSKLKHLQGPHFKEFRDFFMARLERMFVVPANTFDNVSGKFPIGFHIWNTAVRTRFTRILSDVYDRKGDFQGTKVIETYDDKKYINDWIKPFRGRKDDTVIGKFPFKGNDFQNQNMIQIVHPDMVYNKEAGQFLITRDNLLWAAVYFAVRKTPDAEWLNDRDQFLTPVPEHAADREFVNDCLVYTLFSNNIQMKFGVNHWIPFSESEVGARDRFSSHFMYDFINGRLSSSDGIFDGERPGMTPLIFSLEAAAVMNAGRSLWRYYHSMPDSVPDAAYYDIRAYFQGFTDGRMNNDSSDMEYNRLVGELRRMVNLLAEKIVPKVYAYGFLKN